MEIQWYPGHMAKAKRQLETQLSRVNLAVELCDARLPLSSRNPDLDRLLHQKQRVLLLCKADLAEPERTRQWLRYFQLQGVEAMAYDATPAKTKQAKAMIEGAAREMLERGLRRGIQKTIRAMVVGVPNVGKSTFINRLYGGAIAQVGDRPGVTRANQWVKVNPYLEVLDTPGMLWPKLTDKLAATRLAYIGTIRDAVYDQQALCAQLLLDLLAVRREATCERFKIKNPDVEKYELLGEVCRGRGFLLRGGELDYDRCCAVVLDEFREGKIGRITLELPPRLAAKSAESDGEQTADTGTEVAAPRSDSADSTREAMKSMPENQSRCAGDTQDGLAQDPRALSTDPQAKETNPSDGDVERDDSTAKDAKSDGRA